jgi:hypothetical protein
MTYITFLSLALQQCKLIVFARPSVYPSRTTSTVLLSSPNRALKSQDSQAFLTPNLFSMQFQPIQIQGFPTSKNPKIEDLKNSLKITLHFQQYTFYSQLPLWIPCPNTCQCLSQPVNIQTNHDSFSFSVSPLKIGWLASKCQLSFIGCYRRDQFDYISCKK